MYVCMCVYVYVYVYVYVCVCVCVLIRYLSFTGTFFFNCLVGCLSMIVWTPAVLGVLCACVLYFCISTCSTQLSMFDIEKRSRNTLIINIIIIIYILIIILFCN